MIEYRITYKDTQRTAGDENNQIRGISIIDGHRESSSIVGNIIVIGASINMAPPLLSPARPLAERTAFWQTYADFFYVGMTVRITGTTADGDYVITSIALFTPTDLVADDPGSITLEIDGPHGTPELGVSDVLFEDITEPTIVELEGSGQPDLLSIVDNSEDPFTPIRAKQLEIRFTSTSTINAETFCTGADNKWFVKAWINDEDNPDFKGYLVTDDLQDPFLPAKQVVLLTASDRLGTLKDVDLVDDDNLVPTGKWKLIQYISWCLRKTGLSLDIFVVNNIRHGSGVLAQTTIFNVASTAELTMGENANSSIFFYPGQRVQITGTASNNGTFTVLTTAYFSVRIVIFKDATFVTETADATFTDVTSASHLYDSIYVDAKTFEGDEVGKTENCYSVLSKILGESAYIEQAKGSWWIQRINEKQGSSMEVAHFESDGTFVDIQTKTYNKNIGRDDTIKWSSASQTRRFRRPYSFIKETYKYVTPIEIICNMDFSRGDYDSDLTPTTAEINDGAVSAKRFNLDDWTLMRGYPEAPGSPIANDSQVYIKRLYNAVDYESSRYVVMTPPSAPNEASPYILSCPLPVLFKDRFESTATFRLPSNPTFNFFAPMFQFALKGDDGSWWLLTIKDDDISGGSDADGPRWVNTAGWTVNTSLGDYHLVTSGAGGVDFTNPTTITYDFKAVPPIPVNGNLYILLHGLNVSDESSTDDIDVYWDNLSFTYYPFINGSYQKYTGQYHQESQTGEFKAKREKQVYISDAPRKLFKGAMMWFDGTIYNLATNFFDAFVNPTPTGDNVRPYGEIQALDVWYQYQREMRIFSGQTRGLDSDVQDSDDLPDQPDVIHNYLLTDANPSTDNKVFLMLSYEQDRKSQLSQSTLIEVYDSVIGKLPGDHIFKYLSE